MLHLTMEEIVLTLSVLAIILSITSVGIIGIILIYYCCCRNKNTDDGGFVVRYALEENNKDNGENRREPVLDNLSDNIYEEIPLERFSRVSLDHIYDEIPLERFSRVSLEDIYIDDTIED